MTDQKQKSRMRKERIIQSLNKAKRYKTRFYQKLDDSQ